MMLRNRSKRCVLSLLNHSTLASSSQVPGSFGIIKACMKKTLTSTHIFSAHYFRSYSVSPPATKCSASGVVVAIISDTLDTYFHGVEINLDHSFPLYVNMWFEVWDFQNNMRLLGVLELVRCEKKNNVLRCLKLKGCMDLKIGQPVLLRPRDGVPVGRATLGRVINPLGDPIDGQGDIKSEQVVSVYHDPTPVLVAAELDVLFTGIKLIDLLAPFHRGGNIGLFGHRSATNALIFELINNFNRVYGVSVYAEQKGSDLENHDLYQGMIKNGTILLGDKQADSKCALVYSPNSERNAFCSLYVDLAAITLAEHFRDVELQDVLLIRNTITDSQNTKPSRLPPEDGEFAHVPKAIHSRNQVTCVFVYNREGKYNKNEFPHIDCVIDLFGEDARPGIFPERVTSKSRILFEKYVGKDHFRVAKQVKILLAQYKRGECKGPSLIRARKVINFFTQPPNQFVTQADCVKGFAGILSGDFDHIPEEAFCMIGGVDEISGL